MKRLLQYTVLLVLAVNIISTIIVLHATDRTMRAATAQVSDEGVVAFCLDQPPTLIVPCNPNMTLRVPYTCQLNASNPGKHNLSFFQIPQPPSNSTAPVFNVSLSGLINFTPNKSDVGNHSTLLGVDDNSGCENAYIYSLFNFSVTNVNDPPYLVRLIPNQTFYVNTTLYAFFLHDYFNDPDIPYGDHLTFTLIPSTASVAINATIEPDSDVVFSGNRCGKAYFLFEATDTGNLSAESNVVQVEVSCTQPQSGGSEKGNSGSGAGGGAGGVSPACKPQLVCMPWSDCYPNGLQVQDCQDQERLLGHGNQVLSELHLRGRTAPVPGELALQ